MNERNFMDLLRARWEAGFMLCVGLDTDYDLIPQHLKSWWRRILWWRHRADSMFAFNKAIIDSTAVFVCAYKLQVAFYEAAGTQGIRAMIRTVAYIKRRYPHIPIIVDAKRNDIGNTSAAYARAIFEVWGFDAVTANGYMGEKSLRPLLDREGKGVIILCRTSNPGAGEFQDLTVTPLLDAVGPLYKYLAMRVVHRWESKADLLLVVGATTPEELAEVRRICPQTGLLVPGVGKQGADVKKMVEAGLDENGGGMIINNSRAVIYASGARDFAWAARVVAADSHQLISRCRKEAMAQAS